mgnify:FL=1|tara:strand:- start:10152 stop:10493 length:342 start_codon:yes stop_codon:yes gene_type:complete
MIQRPKVKWIAPIVLCGALIAGSSVAIAAATWNDPDGDASVDLSLTSRASREDLETLKAEVRAEMEARKAEMQERLAARVESGEITQAEAEEIREKMAERRAKLEQRKGEMRG